MKEQIKPESNNWFKCSHKDKLPVGDYVLRLKFNGFMTNRMFSVSEYQKEREIRYFNEVAYFKVPDYELKGENNG